MLIEPEDASNCSTCLKIDTKHRKKTWRHDNNSRTKSQRRRRPQKFSPFIHRLLYEIHRDDTRYQVDHEDRGLDIDRRQGNKLAGRVLRFLSRAFIHAAGIADAMNGKGFQTCRSVYSTWTKAAVPRNNNIDSSVGRDP